MNGTKLCIDCRHYRAGESEEKDECHHDKAARGGVRQVYRYSCHAMRAGICLDAILHEPAQPEREAA